MLDDRKEPYFPTIGDFDEDHDKDVEDNDKGHDGEKVDEE